eukprot:6180909-Pyramimonas_sp.AAC.1
MVCGPWNHTREDRACLRASVLLKLRAPGGPPFIFHSRPRSPFILASIPTPPVTARLSGCLYPGGGRSELSTSWWQLQTYDI